MSMHRRLQRRQVDWGAVVDYVMDDLFVNEKEVADLCEVTQQAVSLWRVKSRIPGNFPKKKLTELLRKNGIRLAAFYIGGVPSTTDPEELELIDIYNSLPVASRQMLLEFARFQARKDQ